MHEFGWAIQDHLNPFVPLKKDSDDLIQLEGALVYGVTESVRACEYLCARVCVFYNYVLVQKRTMAVK